jgi:hypothetical protein
MEMQRCAGPSNRKGILAWKKGQLRAGDFSFFLPIASRIQFFILYCAKFAV